MLLVQTGWSRVRLGPLQFRAVPGAGQYPAIIPVAAGAPTIYIPTRAQKIRNIIGWADDTDIMVAGGGATVIQLCIGDQNTGAVQVVVLGSSALANWNGTTLSLGQGFVNPATTLQVEPCLYPPGYLAGRAAADRCLRVITDAGTVTGTLYFEFDIADLN